MANPSTANTKPVSITLPAAVLAAAKAAAAEDGRSLSNFVTQAVRRELDKSEAA